MQLNDIHFNYFSNVDVVIDGSKCITKSETSSKISCETEPHVGSIVADVSRKM